MVSMREQGAKYGAHGISWVLPTQCNMLGKCEAVPQAFPRAPYNTMIDYDTLGRTLVYPSLFKHYLVNYRILGTACEHLPSRS